MQGGRHLYHRSPCVFVFTKHTHCHPAAGQDVTITGRIPGTMRGFIGCILPALILLPPAVSRSFTQEHTTMHIMGEVRHDRTAIAREMEDVLRKDIAQWYPLALDNEYGGFYSDIDYTWRVTGQQNKMIVTQARHVWSASHLAEERPAMKGLLDVAAHGVRFLQLTMWDRDSGGFYDLVDRKGIPLADHGRIIKRAYGNAFAIYGLAAYYKATGDTAALSLARETFTWLENHSHDPDYGGYFQFMARGGTPFTAGYNGTPPKDQNSTIHLLEAFAQLYAVWPDTVLRERLASLLTIVRDTITTKKGYMRLFFDRAWHPASWRNATAREREEHYDLDHVSFGHDVEVGYLLLDAAAALGIPDDSTTLRVAKNMVDHTLDFGWDTSHGGVFDRGYYLQDNEPPVIIRNTKEWWAQVEAMNSLLIMADAYPGDPHRYYDVFCTQWEYCKKFVIDSRYGGWYWGGADIVPDNRTSNKSSIWKANYHTSRALLNCINRLLQHEDQEERTTIHR